MIRPALLAVLAAAALASAACARKSDPVPPEGAIRSTAPQLIAPGEVTDPIRDAED